MSVNSVIQTLRPDIDWSDIDRVNVLYAPFRARTLNPESYDAKSRFWTETIEKWLEHEDTFKFKTCDIANVLQANSRKPLCLADVIQEMKDGKKTITESNEFVKGFQESWTWKILRTGTSYLASTLSPKSKEQRKIEIEQTEYIHLGVLEKQAQKLLEAIKNKADFCKKSDFQASYKDLDTMLGYLQFHKGLIDICQIDDDIYIKDSKFTETDLAVLKLKITIKNLEIAVDQLENEIIKKRTEIKSVIKNSRTKAKHILRQVKHLDADLEKKLSNLDNLRQVLDSIQDVQDNKKIIETLQIAKKALHEEVKDQDVDKIQDLVDDIKNLVETTNEISEALSANSMEETDLEKELEQMLKDEKERELNLALASLTVKDEPLDTNDVKVTTSDKNCQKILEATT